MKKCILFFVILFGLWPMNNLFASKVRAFLSYATFYSPEQGPFIETYLAVLGKSVMFTKNTNNKFQGKLEITMLFKQGDSIRTYKKYELLSPEISDTSKNKINFIDQQRFLLPNGSYLFEIMISDGNCDTIPFSVSQPLEINYTSDSVYISGIQLIEKYKKSKEFNILSKSGFDFIPYVSDYFPENVDTLIFYTEIYNTNKILGSDQKYLLNWDIESFETGKVIGDFIKYKKENTRSVNVLFNQFDIKNLPSGNYYLAIYLKNQNNQLIASNKLFFQRNNPEIQFDIKDIAAINVKNTFASQFTIRETLFDYILSLSPISTEIEKDFVKYQLKKADLKTMQQYFLNFWVKRNSLEPERAWNDYAILVQKVNAAYSTSIRKGYDTDRGRVYLQYGIPNSISEVPYSSEEVPYEIWHYYKLPDNQKNKKFVFCNRDLVRNSYELIHSDALGELSNYNWQYLLQRNIRIGDSQDVINNSGRYSGKSGELYNEPR